jgi:hypothetical protein
LTTSIRDRIEGCTNGQLDAVIEVPESLDIEERDKNIAEYAFCDAPQDVENMLMLMERVREERVK